MSLAATLARINLPLARSWYALRPGARILMYHRVTDGAVSAGAGPDQLTISPALFARQIEWLVGQRKVVPLSTLLHDNASQAARNTVAITFDDGYLDNLLYALPVLERFKAPATLYITTGFAAQQCRHPRYEQEPGRLHLNWEELRTLAQHPLLEIGSHTLSHPMLSELGDAEAAAEIGESKKQLEQELQIPVDSFCYPSGNFSPRDYQLVRQHGYRNAVSVKPGVTRPGADHFALRRTEITWKDSSDNLQLKLSGAYDLLHTALDWRRELQFAGRRRNSAA